MIHYHKGHYVDDGDISTLDFPDNIEGIKGFFTTLKYSQGQFYYLDKHLKRLKKSLEYYNYTFPDIDYNFVLHQLIRINNLQEARIKIMIYEDNAKQSVFIKMMLLEINTNSLRLIIYPEKRKNLESYRHKSLDYSENLAHNREAKAKAYDDYIYIDEKDRILESSFSNVFLLREDILYTPASYLPILPGIIRDIVISDNNIYQVKESEIYLQDLSEYEAGFLTNSIQGIQTILSINEKIFSQRIAEKYK